MKNTPSLLPSDVLLLLIVEHRKRGAWYRILYHSRVGLPRCPIVLTPKGRANLADLYYAMGWLLPIL